ncbi:MAG TPA: HypC/HybG/HupF family hydrogenase formation chaperone [Myxococcota bacterium]|nr:HypC/HybG/HupF family hydrogenase formation chaperone [Myxococcota bacterium]
MCLAVPGRVCELYEEEGLRLAAVAFGGVRMRVCVETLPDVAIGSWVLVHAGVALQELDASAADEALRLLAEAAQGGGSA